MHAQVNRSFVVHDITFALADNVFEFVYENLLLVLRLKVNFKVTKNVFKHWNIEIGKLFAVIIFTKMIRVERNRMLQAKFMSDALD